VQGASIYITCFVQFFRYTYGKAVKGEATVTVYPLYYSGYLQPIFETPIRKVVPIDGKTIVDFDIVKDLK